MLGETLCLQLFPRSRVHGSPMLGSVPGSLGLMNCPTSGWISRPLFLKVLECLMKHTRCTKDSRYFSLIMDNPEFHRTLNTILYFVYWGSWDCHINDSSTL